MYVTYIKTNRANAIPALPPQVALGKKTGLYELIIHCFYVSVIQYILQAIFTFLTFFLLLILLNCMKNQSFYFYQINSLCYQLHRMLSLALDISTE